MTKEVGPGEQWDYDPLAFKVNATGLPYIQDALAKIRHHKETLQRLEDINTDPSRVDWRDRAQKDPRVVEATSTLQYSVGRAIDAIAELFRTDHELTQARRAVEDEIAAYAIPLLNTEVPDDLSEL